MKLRYLLIALVGTLGFASCEKSENTGGVLPKDNIIRVSAEVNDQVARVDGRPILKAFGLFATASEKYSYANINVTKLGDNTWTTTPITMLWQNALQPVEMIAYAPYYETFTDLAAERTISVQADQSSPANLFTSDFLYAKSDVTPGVPDENNAIHYKDEKVKVTLGHHFSKLIIVVTLNQEFNTLAGVASINPITNASINNTKIGVKLKLKDGIIALSGENTAIKPYQISYTPPETGNAKAKGSATYEAIIVPQNLNDLSIELTINGGIYTWTSAAEVTFTSAKSRKLELNVGDGIVTSTSMTVDDWGAEADSNLETE